MKSPVYPRAAYYKWLKRTPSAKELENEEILQDMKATYEKVDGIYGYRRMKLNINRMFHQKFNHKRIYRLMNIAGLQSVIRRKKKRYVLPLNMSLKIYSIVNLLQTSPMKNG